MDPVYEARSCRLLAVPSCGDNPAPNAVEVIDAAEGAFDMVVIMAGYDEWYTTFADSFDQVVASSRAKGAKRIIWLSYPEGVDYLLPDGTPGNESLVNINQIMRDKVATGAFPDVVIADWFNYASAQPRAGATATTSTSARPAQPASPTTSLARSPSRLRCPARCPASPAVPPRHHARTLTPPGPSLDVAALYAT